MCLATFTFFSCVRPIWPKRFHITPFWLKGGIYEPNSASLCLGKGDLLLALHHFVRVAAWCTWIYFTVYFALVAELDGQRTFEPYTNFLDKGTDLISIALSYPCH